MAMEVDMKTYEVDATLAEDQSLVLKGLPFRAGESVRVLISSPGVEEKPSGNRYPLRGLPYEFDDPLTPAVPAEDWDCLR